MSSRLWTYQRERFPLVTHVPFAVLLAVAALGWSTAVARRPAASLAVLAASSVTTLLFLFQLRVADEFKDYEDDVRFRPERAVPRGLVTRRELGLAAALAAVVQLAAALYVTPGAVATLALLWIYTGFMSVEFFVPTWLKAHPAAYLVSHMLVVPVLILHVTAFDWMAADLSPQAPLAVLMAFSFMVGLVVELGRKTWAPEQERVGVDSYSGVWGTRGAAVAFGLAVVAATAAAFWCLLYVDAGLVGTAAVAATGLVGVVVAAAFATSPTAGRAKGIEVFSAVAAFVLYVAVGIVPRYGAALP